jgi:DNA-binding transcriptional ArsR family regulator
MELLGSGGGGALFGGWRQVVRHRLGSRAQSLALLVRNVRPVAELSQAHADRPAELGGWAVAATDGRRDEINAAVQEFYQAAVAPYWARIRNHLEVDRDSRARVVVGSGVEGLLTALHRQITWTPPVLEIRHHLSQEIHLNGRGLLIVPSLFIFDRPGLLFDPRRTDSAPVLVYPAPLDAGAAAALWSTPTCNTKALGALVGRTRAGVLQTLTESCTTTELGRRLGISAAAASQHTAVLREAGLITSQRKLNMVVHTVTSLGSALLKGQPLGMAGRDASLDPTG